MPDTQSPPEQDTVTSRSEPREWHLQNFLSVLYKRRWVAVTTFLIAGAAVAAYSLTGTPVYEAHAQLLLTDKQSVVTLQGVGNQQNDQKGYLETQYRLLRSRSLARRVIDKLDLWHAAGFASNGRERSAGALQLLSRLQDRINAPTTRTPVASEPSSPAESDAPKETLAESSVIDRMVSHLSIVPVRDTQIVDVTYESPDPELAARVVNTLTSTYINQNLEARSYASKEASAWLTDQLAEQRRKVETSELALQKYREQENNLSLDAGENIVVQRLNALNSVVTGAKTDRISVEALYRQLAASQGNPEALDTSPPIRSNNVVQQLKARLADLQRQRLQLSSSLGAKHPEMVQVDAAINAARSDLATEVAKTVESVRQEYLAAQSREKDLTAALDTQKASALALNRQGIAYGVLLREVESNRQIYQNLLQRTNEAAVSSELKSSNIEVVDPAEVPRLPASHNTSSTLLMGLLLSGILAIGMAFVWEVLDNRIQTPEEVKNALGLPFLGMLPYVPSRALKGNTLLLSRGVPAAYAEACRTLRTNVLASAGPKGGRSLLVTSAAPGDGKSIVAVNLAAVLGRTGKRVLVVDADLRRPVLHHLLKCEQRPGLSEVLTGARKPSEAIVATRCSGVWLLPSGSCPSNPSEQLGSRRFRELLEKLGESFDWVIIDSPPVMAVTDAAVIAPHTTGVLFVVNARRTRQRVAQEALDRLETAGASFAGAVLNAVTLDRDHYYNARYYLPCYGDYLTDQRTA
jgi:succinoglycan biosynthesis transport protein ExoP